MKYVYTMLLVCAAYMGQSQVLISILLGDKLNSGKIEFGFLGSRKQFLTSLQYRFGL